MFGDLRCPIVDTWWQTETGGHMISPFPGATALKPGSATVPFFGIKPVILNEKGQECEGACEGVLAIARSNLSEANWNKLVRSLALPDRLAA